MNNWEESIEKGKKAENIVKDMLKEAGFEVFRYGYEYTIPEIPKNYSNLKGLASEFLRHMPDFVVIDENNQVFFVEVKYRYNSEIDLKHIFYYPDCYVVLCTKNGFLAQSTYYLHTKKYDFTYLVNMPPFRNLSRDILDKYSKRLRRELGDENLIGQLVEGVAEKFIGKTFVKEPLKPNKPIIKDSYKRKYYHR